MPVFMKILLDTNILLMPGELGVDIIGELEKVAPGQLYALDRTKEELENLVATLRGKHKVWAKVGLLVLEKGGITLLKTEKVKKGGKIPIVDSLLVDYSRQGYLIATQDRGVQRRIPRYLTLRQKKYFKLMGE
jgi:rRNA-processing protein FCF1